MARRSFLTGRNPDRLEQAAAEVDAQHTAAFDANDSDALHNFFEDLASPIDHVLVTAGGPRYVPLLETAAATVAGAVLLAMPSHAGPMADCQKSGGRGHTETTKDGSTTAECEVGGKLLVWYNGKLTCVMDEGHAANAHPAGKHRWPACGGRHHRECRLKTLAIHPRSGTTGYLLV
jgi:hypothetical protein